MESQVRGNTPEKAVQAKTSSLPPTQTSQLDLVDKKRKWDQKGKKVMDERRKSPSKEVEAQKGSKQPRVMQTRSSSKGAITIRKGDQQMEVPA